MTNLSERVTLRRHPERSVPDEFCDIMVAGDVIHASFASEGQPHVTPLAYHFDSTEPGMVYVHGSRDSRAIKTLAGGAPACLCVTIVDGLVYSRIALTHSMNYRSAICFVRGREVTDLDAKRRAFEAMTRRYFPGRSPGIDYEAATDAQLCATLVAAMVIEEGSAKARRGGPNGPTDNDPSAFGTCGVSPPRNP